MFQQANARKEKGNSLARLAAKLRYTESVDRSEILGSMLLKRKAKDLKRGDKWVIPSGVIDGENPTIDVEEETFLPRTGTENGMLVLEVTSTPQETSIGVRGTSFTMTLINIESDETKSVEMRHNLAINEEVFMIVTDDLKEQTILILNDTITVPRRTEEKKAVKPTGKDHLKLFAKVGTCSEEEGAKESRENAKKTKDIRKSIPWLRKSVENKQAEMIVSEGGLKSGAWYLERIKSASREHLNGTMGAVDENGKWQEADSELHEDREVANNV